MEPRNPVLDIAAEHLQDQYTSAEHPLPPDVEEAFQILMRVFEILSDPATDDMASVQALRKEIPRTRIIWARKVFYRWETADERRDLARKRQRWIRRKNKGKHMERSLSEKKNQQLYDEFVTHDILNVIDNLDEVRAIISDQFNEDGFPRPPELRTKLLKLHQKAHHIINEYDCDKDDGMFDLAWEIEDEIFTAIENLEKIQEVIQALTDLTPSEDEGDEDADEWEKDCD